MVTWSEGGMRGKVVAAKVTLSKDGNSSGEEKGKDSFINRLLGKFQGL